MSRAFVLGALALAFASTAPFSAADPVPISEGVATSADGTRIYYRVAGDGGDVVIAPFALLHVAKLDGLASPKRRIVTYDPRGRGLSDRVPPEKVSLDLLLSDLDGVRKAVGAERVAIIGWSGGGMEMFVYALRNPAHVTRLVQLTPIGPRAAFGEAMMKDREARTDKAARDKLRQRIAAGEFKGREADLCRATNAVSLPTTLADPNRVGELPDVCNYENEWDSNLGPYFDALLGSFGEFDWRKDLPKVTIPRLVIHGEADNIPLASSEEWVRGASNARLMIVKAAGHWPHYEQPQTTLPAIAKFLDGEWPPEAIALAP